MKTVLLETCDLSVGYEGRAVLEQLSVQVRRGELLTLIGPNGGGKSTLLKTLAGQLPPLGGHVLLEGENLSGIPPQTLARRLAVLLTDRISPERLNCSEVVSAGRYPYTGRLGILSREDWRKVEEAMELMNIASLACRPFAWLSDGQRQRVMIARALCQEPELLLLDEPTSYLDVRHKLELLDLLRRLARERNLAVVLSLHELDLAQRASDRVLCLRDGKALAWGTPEEVFTRRGISALYQLPAGSYDPNSGGLELPRLPGPPRVFVIGGGGLGIPVYRKLRREGIPFAVGVLHENDLDYPVASSLAEEVVTERAFEPIGAAALERARSVLSGCACVICCPERFGALNRGNAQLLRAAGEGVRRLRAEEYLFEGETV